MLYVLLRNHLMVKHYIGLVTLVHLGPYYFTNDATISSSNVTTSDFTSGTASTITSVTGKKMILGALTFYSISSISVKTLSGWTNYGGVPVGTIEGCIPVISSNSYLVKKSYTTSIKDNKGYTITAELEFVTLNSYGTWKFVITLNEPSGQWNSVSANQAYTMSNTGIAFVVHNA